MSIAENLQILEYRPGDKIISQGEEATSAYMILSGKVRVYLEDGTKIVELAELGEDQIFGESALITSEPYGANVEAVEPTEIYVITPQSLHEMLGTTDPIIRALIQMLIARLKATNEALLKSETREFIDVGMI